MGGRDAAFLLSKGRSGDRVDRRQRFEAEALPFMRALYGAAYHMTRNVDDAQDLVQETFVRAWRGFHRFQPGTNLRAWLFTILARARTDALRRRRRRPAEVELLGEGPSVAPAQERLASGIEDLERALAGLPETYRTAVVLRDVHDLSYKEIAEALDVALGTVMSRLHRGRALLREALSGGTP
jgi:RNA polymerase sigma-70 factor (ECF subfamily)